MHLLYLIAFLSVVGPCLGLNFSADHRIIGGIPAQRGDIPYQVSLRYNNDHICGGSLYTNRHVITAAHCVVDKGKVINPSNVRIAAGGINLIDSGAQMRQAIYIVVHESYNSKIFKNDIAIVKVDPSFVFSSYISDVPIRTSNIPDNSSCTVSGWGVTTLGGSISNSLLKTNVSITNQQICKNAYSGFNDITGDMICAAAPNKDSCQGDSGGPLVCGGQLTGVVSWGEGCANSNYPGVYARVSSFSSWIQKHGGAHGVQSSFLTVLLLSAASLLFFFKH